MTECRGRHNLAHEKDDMSALMKNSVEVRKSSNIKSIGAQDRNDKKTAMR